jgi:hypothetical protein
MTSSTNQAMMTETTATDLQRKVARRARIPRPCRATRSDTRSRRICWKAATISGKPRRCSGFLT